MIIGAALDAVDARLLVERGCRGLSADWRNGTVHVLAAGKASIGMARAARDWLEGRQGRMLVVGPGPAAAPHGGFADTEVVAAGHPVPTDASVAAGREALAFAAACRPEERLLVLLSGGASALMAVPAPGVTLDEKAATTRLLLRGGATIHQANAVRKHLSAIKGGQLATAGRARVLTLAISDVIGDDLSVIGSGPSVPDSSSFAEALEVIRTIDDGNTCPAAVRRRLEQGARGEIAETPKPGDSRFAGHEAYVVGGRSEAMAGAARAAERQGYRTIVLREPVDGEAREAGPSFLSRVTAAAGESREPVCVIASGETTVKVVGGGRGGRNQEFALACVEQLAGLGRPAVLASIGTDGVDGPTDAAGAMVDQETAARALGRGFPAAAPFLSENDAYRFLEATGDLIVTGPTGTNVGDVQIALLAPAGRAGAPDV